MSTRWTQIGIRYSSRRLNNAVLCIVLRELHSLKGPDTEAIFAVVCPSDILKQHYASVTYFSVSLICTNCSDLPEFRMTSSACDVTSAVILTAVIRCSLVGHLQGQ